MYEKPQYLTKDGYKRLSKNPHSAAGGKKKVRKTSQKKRGSKIIRRKGKKMSPEAAKLIAETLRVMLKS
jgi:hypothetical protein